MNWVWGCPKSKRTWPQWSLPGGGGSLHRSVPATNHRVSKRRWPDGKHCDKRSGQGADSETGRWWAKGRADLL